MTERVLIYTDGGCRGNPGIGGWGALLLFKGRELELKGAERDTTNNRMELTATISALNALKRSCMVDLYTDSVYVKDGITKWMDNWLQNNWKNSQGKPVKNKDLWLLLNEAIERHDIDWHWVKGHAGEAGNERADQLANEAMDELINNEQPLA